MAARRSIDSVIERDWTAFVDEHGSLQAAADALGISYDAMRFRRARQRRQAERSSPPHLGMPGFATKSVAAKHGDTWVKQTRGVQERLYAIPTGQSPQGRFRRSLTPDKGES